MAGSKGKSGGARSGAGRKRNDSVANFDVVVDLTELRKLKRRLTMMDNTSVEWGFFEDSVYTNPDEPDRVGKPVADIAAKHEYGYPALKIPPRPFFTQSLVYATTEVMIQSENLFNLLINKRKPAYELKKLGKSLVETIRYSIEKGTFKALSPQTIKHKGNDVMLDETGVMKDSIDYKVVSK
jgi:hypothetical protein